MSLHANSPELGQWVTLHHLPQAGGRVVIELLEHFGSIAALFDAPRGELARFFPEQPKAIAAILGAPNTVQTDTVRDWLAADATHHLVTWTDTDYPPLLREIADPPMALYVLGERACLTSMQLAVVGSRNPTPAGTENARAFAKALAQSGLTIT